MIDKFDEILKELQELNLVQKSIDWQEDLPDNIWDKYSKDLRSLVASNLDIDTHRWYELSVDVFKINDRYLGVRFISNIFSESMNCEDVYHILEFFEMKPVTTITYEKL